MGRLVILDPSLRRRAGHHFNYAAALLDVCRERGLDFIAYSHAGIEESVSAELPSKAAFRVDTYQSLDNPGVPRTTYEGIRAHETSSAVTIAQYVVEDMRRIEGQFQAGDVIFFHTLNQAQFLGLAQWLSTSPGSRAPGLKFVFLLRFWHMFPSIVAPFFKIGAIAMGTLPISIRLCADTTELAIAYGEMTGSAVDVVPIPHTSEASPAQPDLAGGPVISYLGHSRMEKGSHFLDQVVSRVLASGEPARFILQQPPAAEAGPMLDRLKALSSAFPERITLAEGDLSRAEYNDCLDRSHIVLLSYDPVSYRYRSSGVFIEAAAAGKVAVIPARSSMHTEAMRFQAAFVPFSAFEPQAIADATIKAVRGCREMLPAAAAARPRVLAHHNAGALMDYLFS